MRAAAKRTGRKPQATERFSCFVRACARASSCSLCGFDQNVDNAQFEACDFRIGNRANSRFLKLCCEFLRIDARRVRTWMMKKEARTKRRQVSKHAQSTVATNSEARCTCEQLRARSRRAAGIAAAANPTILLDAIASCSAKTSICQLQRCFAKLRGAACWRRSA